jgi:hypothetical protein
MKRVIGKLTAPELTLVEAVDENANSAKQSIWATRETPGRTSQTSQIVTQFGIPCFYRIGFSLSFRDFITTEVEPQRGIRIEGIAEIPFGLWCQVDNILEVI